MAESESGLAGAVAAAAVACVLMLGARCQGRLAGGLVVPVGSSEGDGEFSPELRFWALSRAEF